MDRQEFTTSHIAIALVLCSAAASLFLGATILAAEPPATDEAKARGAVRQTLKSEKADELNAAIVTIVLKEWREFAPELGQIAGTHRDPKVRLLATAALLRLDDMDLPAEQRDRLRKINVEMYRALGAPDGNRQDNWAREAGRYSLREFAPELERIALTAPAANASLQAVIALNHLAEGTIGTLAGRLHHDLEQETDRQALARVMEEAPKYAKAHEKEILDKLANGTPEEKAQAVRTAAVGHLSSALPLVRKIALQNDIAGFEAGMLIKDWKGTKEEDLGNMDAVRTMMRSAESSVKRFWAAATLLHKNRDKEAVAVLIGLIRSTDAQTAVDAWVTLYLLTGKKLDFGKITSKSSQEEREALAQKWEAWWKENGETFK